jgi:hypothetical protein
LMGVTRIADIDHDTIVNQPIRQPYEKV